MAVSTGDALRGSKTRVGNPKTPTRFWKYRSKSAAAVVPAAGVSPGPWEADADEYLEKNAVHSLPTSRTAYYSEEESIESFTSDVSPVAAFPERRSFKEAGRGARIRANPCYVCYQVGHLAPQYPILSHLLAYAVGANRASALR